MRSVGCVDMGALTSQNTPTQILLGARKCVDDKEYDRGASLFTAAGAYGKFDSLRVPDVSAHTIIPDFESALFGQLDNESKANFKSAVEKLYKSDADRLNVCAQLRTLGPPTYYPTYMLLHGMSQFTGRGGGLRDDFNRDTAWETALSTYVKCPSPSH